MNGIGIYTLFNVALSNGLLLIEKCSNFPDTYSVMMILKTNIFFE